MYHPSSQVRPWGTGRYFFNEVTIIKHERAKVVGGARRWSGAYLRRDDPPEYATEADTPTNELHREPGQCMRAARL